MAEGYLIQVGQGVLAPVLTRGAIGAAEIGVARGAAANGGPGWLASRSCGGGAGSGNCKPPTVKARISWVSHAVFPSRVSTPVKCRAPQRATKTPINASTSPGPKSRRSGSRARRLMGGWATLRLTPGYLPSPDAAGAAGGWRRWMGIEPT